MAAIAFAHAEAKPDVKYALVVGNSAYAAESMKLKNASKDATDMAATLRAQGFEVDLVIDATEVKFRDAVGNLERKALDADIALFYYAGHGLQSKRKNFLLPVDNVPRDIVDVRQHSVSVDKIVEAAASARKAKIVILDACRNKGGKQEDTRSLSAIGDGDGLAAVDGGEGLVVFFSAQHGKVAYDGSKGDHSPFAEAMLKHVAVPGRKLVDVLESVSRDVSQATMGNQAPEIMTASLGGESEIYLNPRESSAAVWRRIKVVKDPKTLKQFISDYPDSPEAETAQSYLDRLDFENREIARRKEAEERAAQTKAALEALKKQQDDALAAAERKRKQDEDDKAAAAKKLADIEAGLKASREAQDAKEAEARRRAEAKAEEEKRLADARREDEARKALVAAEAAKKAEEARARQTLEAAEKAAAAKKAQEAADLARKQAEDAARLQLAADEAAKEELKRDAEAKAAEARVAEEAVARARDLQRAAEMEALTRARLADLAEVDRQAAEAARVAAVQAAQEKSRREAEAEQKRLTEEACASDLGRLQSFRQSGQADAVKLLRDDSKCPTLAPVAERALSEIAAAAQKVCEADKRTLSRIDARDETALTTVAGQLKCDDVKKSALDLAERARADKAAVQAACANEEVALTQIDPSLPESQPALAKFAGSTCAPTREHATKLIAEFSARVGDMQGELVQMGCLPAAKASRKFDDDTREALKLYFAARHAPQETLAVTQRLIDEMTDQDFAVCAPQSPQAPVIAKAEPGPAPNRPVLGSPTQAAPSAVSPPPTVRVRKPQRPQAVEPSTPAVKPTAPPRKKVVVDSSGPAVTRAPVRQQSSGGKSGGGGGGSVAPAGGGGGGFTAPPSM